MDIKKDSLEFHEVNKGKIEIRPKVTVSSKEELSLAYTPGVSEPCMEIAKDSNMVYRYTSKGNMVAIVTDGSAVLSLGDIGPEAALPVMEGKAILFKKFGGIDAFPICLDTKDIEEIIKTIKLIAPGFGGINLEDISAPRCFEIEKRLQQQLSIPVFHDDQHGTAIVVIAGLLNALKIVNKEVEDIHVVINGAGAAGVAIANMLRRLNPKDIIICDSKGIIYCNRNYSSSYKQELTKFTNKNNRKGSLREALMGADVFIGVSSGNVVSENMIKSMNKDSIVFALANPIPEIHPYLALRAGAKVVATGRSDFPNQINNVLAFPGIFKGVLLARATHIDEEMKLGAAYAIAKSVKSEELSKDKIVPDTFDLDVVKKVAKTVKEIAIKNLYY